MGFYAHEGLDAPSGRAADLDGDETTWMEWFLGCLGRAIGDERDELAATLRKASFSDSMAGALLNERQRMMLNRWLDGFAGKLATSKWALLTKCSQDTAHRDIQSLVAMGVLARGPEGGRNAELSVGEQEPRWCGNLPLAKGVKQTEGDVVPTPFTARAGLAPGSL